MLEWVLAAVGIVVVVGVVKYVLRRGRMQALRRLPHLAEFATGLGRLQAELVERGRAYPPRPSDRTRTPMLTTDGGVMFGWTYHRNGHDCRHALSLHSGWRTWWIDGFLLAYAVDRLGMPWPRASMGRTRDGVCLLSITLTQDEHAAVLDRPVGVPTTGDLDELVARIEGLVAERPPGPYLSAPPEWGRDDREAPFELGDGCHGVEYREWDRDRAAARLAVFQQAGPGYSLPIRAVRVRRGISRFVGNLYVALYPLDDFEDQLDFEMFVHFASSILQDLIATGELDMSWYHPYETDGLLTYRQGVAEEGPDRPQLEDLVPYLREVGLPDEAAWVLDLDFQSWEVDAWEDGIRLHAKAREGYLTLFTVDD